MPDCHPPMHRLDEDYTIGWTPRPQTDDDEARVQRLTAALEVRGYVVTRTDSEHLTQLIGLRPHHPPTEVR